MPRDGLRSPTGPGDDSNGFRVPATRFPLGTRQERPDWAVTLDPVPVRMLLSTRVCCFRIQRLCTR